MGRLLEHVIGEILKEEKVETEPEISILFVDDDAIKKMNLTYRGIDQPTDVLSFAMRDQPVHTPMFITVAEHNVLGDVVISLETARRQADDYGHSLAREVGFLAVHGMLHLLGYDHLNAEDESKMRQKEERVLAAAGLVRR